MKHLRIMSIVALVFCVVVLLLSILDYLALHDIRQDYLSRHMIDYFGLTFSEELPAWTTTAGEWRLVGISLVARLAFLVFISVVLLRVLKWQKEIKGRV